MNIAEKNSFISFDSDWYKSNEKEIKIKISDIAKTFAINQIKTQSKLVFFTSKKTKNSVNISKEKISLSDYSGNIVHVPQNFKNILYLHCAVPHYGGIVFSEIKNCTIHVDAVLVNVILTKCENVTVEFKNKIYAGLEILNCKNIFLKTKDIIFLSCIYTSNLEVSGTIDERALFDLRNSIDVKIKNQKMMINEFSIAKYCVNQNCNATATEQFVANYSSDNYFPEFISLTLCSE